MELSAQQHAKLIEFIDKMEAAVDYRPFDITVQVYSGNAYITVARRCFAFMFTNIGDTIATVKGMVVFPSATPLTALGDSRSLSGHKNDVYTGTMDLSFRAPVGVAPAVEVVQLYYI